MIDGHTHLEYGELCIDYVEEFIKQAKEKGLTTLHILDHTHRFIEFEPIYATLRNYTVQDIWLSNKKMKFKDSLVDYVALIQQVKQKEYGIEVLFGLEVCYSVEKKQLIKQILKPFTFDFLVGAVHSIDGILYDMPFSKQLLWDAYDPNYIYKRYYECVMDVIDSHLFTQLAHPDTIKLFEIYPTYDLQSTYEVLAIKLKENHMAAENNTGCYYRYHHPDMGLNNELLSILEHHKVDIITCSDAHKPEDVGTCIEQLTKKKR